MSTNASLFPLAAAGLTAFALAAALFISTDFARAGEPATAAAGCLCPKTGDIAANSKLADLKSGLDQTDEDAALESVQLALTEVADGSSYIWHRSHGRLSGVVKPLSSFKDTHGAVCRHAVVVLSGVSATKRTEIVACRLPTGVWQLES
jgi:surface antigen